MDNHIVQALEFESDSIRTTPDGRMSVFDFIRVVGGQKGERKVWERLVSQYPEIIPFCHNFKFAGKGQRNTPVADREGILQILGLLPGLAGKKYRREAARLVLAFYQAPEDLVVAAFDRIQDPVKIQRTQARIESIATRKLETAAFAATGLVTEGRQYAELTNATYEGFYGKTAQQLKLERGLSKKDSLRDALDSEDELNSCAIRLSEMAAARKAKQANSYIDLKRSIFEQAQRVKEAIA